MLSIAALDLDCTVLACYSDLHRINRAHSLSAQSYQSALVAGESRMPVEFFILNPEKLAKLIEEACTKYDGVLFLTAGDWSPEVVSILAGALNLSMAARQKLCDSRFHSPEIDSKLFGLDRLVLRGMDKCKRLKMIIDHYPALNQEHIVLVDDSLYHVQACRVNEPKINVEAVLATTFKADDGFYDEALSALASGVEKENKLDSKERFTCIDIETTPEPSLDSSSSVTPKQLPRSKSSPSVGGFFCPCNRKAHQGTEALSARHSGPGRV